VPAAEAQPVVMHRPLGPPPLRRPRLTNRGAGILAAARDGDDRCAPLEALGRGAYGHQCPEPQEDR